MLPGCELHQLTPNPSLTQPPRHPTTSHPPQHSQPPSTDRGNPTRAYTPPSADYGEEESFIAEDEAAEAEAETAAAEEAATVAVSDPQEAPQLAQEAELEAAGQAGALNEAEADAAEVVAAPAEESGHADMKLQGERNAAHPHMADTHASATDAPTLQHEEAAAADLTQCESGAAHKEVESVSGGSGIMDEYLRRMHFPKEEGEAAPNPPEGAPGRVSMPRQWTKTNSYPEGEHSTHHTGAWGRQSSCQQSALHHTKRRRDTSDQWSLRPCYPQVL